MRAVGGGSQGGRSASLDGIRGVAVLSVLAYHAHYPWARGGFLGVDVFFVLSGFLITRVLLRWDDRRLRCYLTFLRRRFARLVPTLAVMLLSLLILTIGCGSDTDREQLSRCTLASAGYLMNLPAAEQLGCAAPWHITWSLAAEEQFYLCWPWLLAGLVAVVGVGHRRRGTQAAAGVALALYVTSLLWQARLHAQLTPTARVLFAPDTRSCVLLLGCAAALLSASHRWAGRPARRLAELSGVAYLLALPLAFAGNGWTSFAATTLTGVAAAAVVLAADVAGACLTTRLLSTPWLAGIGRSSYSLYLWHEVAYRLAELAYPRGSLACESLRWTLTLTLGIGSYIAVERPGQRLLQRQVRPGWPAAPARQQTAVLPTAA